MNNTPSLFFSNHMKVPPPQGLKKFEHRGRQELSKVYWFITIRIDRETNIWMEIARVAEISNPPKAIVFDTLLRFQSLNSCSEIFNGLIPI